MIIIGIDPGSRFTGFGVIKVSGTEFEHLEHGVITINPDLPFAQRLGFLSAELQPLWRRWPKAVTVVEKVFLGKSADSAFKLGHARGVCLAMAAAAGAEVVEYATREVKKTVAGSGAADKLVVQRVVEQLLKITTAMRADASDALALALCHAYRFEQQQRFSRLKEYHP